MELRNSLTSQLGVDLATTVTIDYPTVPALGQYIATILPHEDEADTEAKMAGPLTGELAGPAIAIADLRWVAAAHSMLISVANRTVTSISCSPGNKAAAVLSIFLGCEIRPDQGSGKFRLH